MSRISPIYTVDNTSVAWQLEWTLTLFWREATYGSPWLNDLKACLENDGIRILAHQRGESSRSQFLLSMRPDVKPVEVAGNTKGRLQYLLRDETPAAFRRNYDLHSLGSTQLEKVEAYVANQLEHHQVDVPEVKWPLTDLQFVDPEIDLIRPRFTSHGRYRCNLHVSLRFQESVTTDAGDWERTRTIIRRTAAAKRHLLSRIGMIPDHVHFVLGFSFSESPLALALSYMNNIAYAFGMKDVLRPSCYLGAIGEYDLGAIHDSSWLPRE